MELSTNKKKIIYKKGTFIFRVLIWDIRSVKKLNVLFQKFDKSFIGDDAMLLKMV